MSTTLDEAYTNFIEVRRILVRREIFRGSLSPKEGVLKALCEYGIDRYEYLIRGALLTCLEHEIEQCHAVTRPFLELARDALLKDKNRV